MIMVVVNLVNLSGAWIAVHPPFGLPQTGVDGVAVAAIISQLAGLVLQYGYVSHKLGISLILPRKLLKSQEIREIFRIGGPSAVEIMASHSAQLILTSMASMISAEALITRAYLQNIMMFLMMVAMAVGQATQIMTAHLVGAGRRIEAYERSRKNATYTLAVVVVMTCLVALNGQKILGLYTETSSVIQLGRALLFITMFLECGRALNLVAAQTMKGMGETRYPAIVGILVGWGVGVLFSYILGVRLEFGLIGIWLAMAMDEWARAVLLWRGLRAKK
jgi:Na+-driven multidrug efflux pump